jgi:steroid 5-alpha reductase family enzyme
MVARFVYGTLAVLFMLASVVNIAVFFLFLARTGEASDVKISAGFGALIFGVVAFVTGRRWSHWHKRAFSGRAQKTDG